MAGSSNFLGINTGTDAERSATTKPGGISYVLAWITDTARLWFFDGATTGGIEVALASDLPSAGAPLSPTDGGTGVSNPTAHTIPVNEGSSAQNDITLADGEIIIGQSSGDPAAKAVSGDATLADTGALTLAASGVTAGTYTYGSFAVDSKGRLTAASSGTAPPSAANPSGKVGLAAVDGSATTFMRSDAAPPIDESVSPTWTGTHTFSNSSYSALFTGGNVGIGTTTPTRNLAINAPLNTYLSIDIGGTETWVLGSEGADGSRFVIYNTSLGSYALIILPSNNYVGIGTTGPQAQLDVNGGIRTAAYTVSTLPTGQGAGTRAFVTDSTVAASGNFGNVVVGGGSNHTPVYYDDGTSTWRIG